MRVFRVPWSSASFLVYLGGLTILGAVGSLLEAEAGESSPAGLVGWALLVFMAVTALAFAARRAGRHVTAGLLALSSVAAFVVLLGALLDWFGWLAPLDGSAFDGFRVSLLFLELEVVLSAVAALVLFRFPLLVLVAAGGSWFFVTDLLSDGGDGSAVVTLLFGLATLAAAVIVDAAMRAYGLWLHVVAGLTIGGALLWFLHESDAHWILIAVAGALYLVVGHRLARSSWVVLGAWGILQTTAHFAARWSDIVGILFPLFYLFPFVLGAAFDDAGGHESHPWAAALLFALVGLIFVALGQLIARRGREAEL